MKATRAGVVLAAIGGLSIFVGLLSGLDRCAVPGAPCPSPRPLELLVYGGLVLLITGTLVLVRSGWRGTASAWVSAAVATVPATWTVYELARQGPCTTAGSGLALMLCNAMPFGLGQMGAPVLSALIALLVLSAGGLRLWHRRA